MKQKPNPERDKDCEAAAEIARAFVLKQAEKEGLKVEKILKKLVEAMDANENKVFFDKDRGRCFVGPEQIAWMPRLKAIDTAIGLLGIKAPDKQEVSGNLDFNHDLSPELQEVFNRIYEKGKASDSHRRASKL